MGTNTPNSPSKDGNLPFGEKRQKIPTDNEMDAEFDVAPFRSSGLDTPMDHTSIAASHNSAKLDQKLQHPALPLSDDLLQNITSHRDGIRAGSCYPGGKSCSASGCTGLADMYRVGSRPYRDRRQ
jgi:hypothetical protein